MITNNYLYTLPNGRFWADLEYTPKITIDDTTLKLLEEIIINEIKERIGALKIKIGDNVI
jgi:hypothetical protein